MCMGQETMKKKYRTKQKQKQSKDIHLLRQTEILADISDYTTFGLFMSYVHFFWLFNKDVHFYVQFYRTHDKFPYISYKRWLYSQANNCCKQAVVSLGTLRVRLVRFSSASGNQSSSTEGPLGRRVVTKMQKMSLQTQQKTGSGRRRGKRVFGLKWKACSQAITATQILTKRQISFCVTFYCLLLIFTSFFSILQGKSLYSDRVCTDVVSH